MIVKALLTIAAAGAALLGSGPSSFFGFEAKNIEEKPVSMKQFNGKVVMVVNVASKCGLTPQYAELEKLFSTYKKDGLVVIGFPANDFAGQEPGTNKEIAAFCKQNYSVTFPMMAKVSVKSDPIYKWLIQNSDEPEQPIQWNFEKFLVDRNGQVRYRFSPKVKPMANDVIDAVKTLLAEEAQ